MTLHTKLTQEILTGPTGPKIAALFDLDHTLLNGFSATAFFRERLLSGRMAPRELADSVLGALSFGLGRTGFSGLVQGAAAAYRGVSERMLEEFGEEVFDKHLAGAIYPEARALVRAHQEAGHTVAIVSSATPYQVEPIAREMQIHHVLCTRLEVVDGIFTGRVVHPPCFGEGKATAADELATRYDVDMEASYFYTDSYDDLPLLEAVGNPRPLNPDRRLLQLSKERGWPVRNFTSRGVPSVGDLARTAMIFGSLVPSALAGLATGIVNQSKREGLNTLASFWGDFAISLAGIDLRVEGEEHLWEHRPAVFIFNHQSALDALLMIKLLRRDITGVGKEELKYNPIFGPLFGLAGMAFIDRSDTARAIEGLKPAVEALRNGQSLIVAPEGTRSSTPHPGPFKKGAFRIAMEAGVPIVPVVFRNVLDALAKNALVVRPTTIEAVVLPPIDVSDWHHDDLPERIEGVRELYLRVLEP